MREWRVAVAAEERLARAPHPIFRHLCAVSTLFLLFMASPGHAQSSAAQISGTVVDAGGAPVAGAQILDRAGHLLSSSAADGSFTVPAGVPSVEISAAHFAPATITIQGAGPIRVSLTRPLESVTVTAYRSPLASLDSPVSTRVLNLQTLREAAPPALDGKLRLVPGFELFRRSSSLVANPTTEGVSLRGLGSTAASRSLVVFDDVPLNDPFGGWIHWEELPSSAIHSVDVVRGGASDLYGSSAIGGVISITPVRPATTRLELSSSYGSESTTESTLLGTVNKNKWSGLLSAGLIATDGYTLIAPSLRGPIDRPSNVHAPTALVQFGRDFGKAGSFFLRGNTLDESRHNGTPLTTNGTRLWRYVGGADWSNLVLRLYGDNVHFRQTFSSVNAARTSETLVRSLEDPADELGAAGHWHQPVGANLLLLGGADIHDVRASDDETLFSGKGSLLNTTARQRQTGVYGEVLFTPKAWTFTGSARVDHFSNFDAYQIAVPGSKVQLPSFSETVFDPRIGISRRLTPSLALNASAFRAYRAPTENELYRTSQVGQQVTKPNANLRSERATGWEAGMQTDLNHFGSSLRVSYFWTQINRPITALTLSTTPTSETLQRENLGQIESRGISVDYAAVPVSWISIAGGYQYADATITKFSQEPDLVGNWIPQVARNMATAQIRFNRRRLGVLSFQGRLSGRQYDDDLNRYLLHPYFRLDAYASHDLYRHIEIFASGENLFDRTIEVGKTPQTTLGTPRIARFGVRLTFGE